MQIRFLPQKMLMSILFTTLLTVLFTKPIYPIYLWVEDERGYKYKLDDGSFRSTWKWLDLNNDGIATCFYFDQDGYLLRDTITPDGNQVDDMGQWVVNGIVQEKAIIDENKPKSEEEFRKLLDKKYAEFVVKCDLAANEYLNVLKDDPELYIDTDELHTRLTEYYRNEFRPLIETMCSYYGFSNDIAHTYIKKADNYSYNKYKQVVSRINKN